MERCGWDERPGFAGGAARRYELYAEFGLALGKSPTARDAAVNALTCAVVPLPEAEFYHFGTNGQMIESVSALQNLVLDETKVGRTGAAPAAGPGHPELALRRRPAARGQPHALGREQRRARRLAARLASTCSRACRRTTGPCASNPGVCLDFVPVGEDQFCVRAYGFNDTFRGPLGDAATRWFGRPAARLVQPRAASSRRTAALIRKPTSSPARSSPCCAASELDAGVRRMALRRGAREPDADFARRWRELPRLSAQQIPEQVNLRRLYEQRARLRQACLLPMLKNFRWSVFFRLDLEATARAFAASQRRAARAALRRARRPDAAGARPDVPLGRPAAPRRAGLGDSSRPAPSPGCAR